MTVAEAIAEHERRFIVEVKLSKVGSQRDRFPQNAFCLLQRLLNRSLYLLEGYEVALRMRNVLLAALAARAHLETTGAVAHFLRKLIRYYETKIPFEELDETMARLTLGAKPLLDKELGVEPINSLTAIDSLDKHLKEIAAEAAGMIRTMYENLSQLCHPNYHGIDLGCTLDEKAIRFSHPQSDFDKEIGGVRPIAESSAILFCEVHRAAIELLKLNKDFPEHSMKPPTRLGKD